MPIPDKILNKITITYFMDYYHFLSAGIINPLVNGSNLGLKVLSYNLIASLIIS